MTITGEAVNQEVKKRENKAFRELMQSAIRAVEGEGNERKFILSFSSELPYERYWGSEILDHSGGCVDVAAPSEGDTVYVKINA